MTTQPLPVAIALWALAWTVVGAAAFMIASSIGHRVRHGRFPDLKGAVFGTLIVAIPAGVFAFVAIFVSALLLSIGVPPLAYLFVSLAALVALRGTVKASGYGMDGCSKMIGMVSAAYVALWGAVSFWFVGGPGAFTLDADARFLLQPPIAALPIALTFTLLSGKKRTVWRFVSALVVAAAFAALICMPVAKGFGAVWLPASDWLRFPLAGMAFGVLFALATSILGLTMSSKAARRGRLKNVAQIALLLGFLGALTGLAWVAAGAAIERF